MADTTTISTLYSSDTYLTQHLTGESDGTGETAVSKLDISTLAARGGSAPTSVTVLSIEFIVSAMNYVVLAWDATTDDTISILAGSGLIDFEPHGGKIDPKSSGTTGDVLLTTDGAVNGAMYDIIIKYRLEV